MGMNFKKTHFQGIILASFFSSSLSALATPEKELETIQKVKSIEKRFEEALKQTSPVYYEAQKKLLRESFDLYAESIELAMKSENGHFISSVVKLCDMLVDNDSTDSTAEKLYQLYLKKKLLTSNAIEGLEASSAKKLKNILKVRERVHKTWAENKEKAK